jgi:hypothetical protein
METCDQKKEHRKLITEWKQKQGLPRTINDIPEPSDLQPDPAPEPGGLAYFDPQMFNPPDMALHPPAEIRPNRSDDDEDNSSDDGSSSDDDDDDDENTNTTGREVVVRNQAGSSYAQPYFLKQGRMAGASTSWGNVLPMQGAHPAYGGTAPDSMYAQNHPGQSQNTMYASPGSLAPAQEMFGYNGNISASNGYINGMSQGGMRIQSRNLPRIAEGKRKLKERSGPDNAPAVRNRKRTKRAKDCT